MIIGLGAVVSQLARYIQIYFDPSEEAWMKVSGMAAVRSSDKTSMVFVFGG